MKDCEKCRKAMLDAMWQGPAYILVLAIFGWKVALAVFIAHWILNCVIAIRNGDYE